MSGSDTASFTDPGFLAHFGLSRVNVLEYFLHPLNPFRSQTSHDATPCCNELLAMQHISIGLLMQNGTGTRAGPLSLSQAEEEYNAALSRLTGEQYELLPPPPSTDVENPQAPLFVIRHVLRKNPTVAPVLGIYYVLEGVIYKSPSMRTLMKSNIARTAKGLQDACDVLSSSAWYSTSSGYFFDFESKSNWEEEEDEEDILARMKQKGKRTRRVLDNRPPGERTEEEEEGLRSKEKMNSILLRLSKSAFVQDF